MTNVVQQTIDRLAERLGRSVVVNDAHVRLLYASPHYGDEDAVRTQAVLQRDAGPAAVGHVLAQGVQGWRAPGVIPAYDAIGMRRRVCVPVWWRGAMVGMLLVLDPEESLPPDGLALLVAAADDLAPLVADQEQDPAETEREAALGDLLAEEPALRRGAVRVLAGHVELEGLEVVQVAEVGAPDGTAVEPAHVRAALRHGVRPGRFTGVRERVLTSVGEWSASLLVTATDPLGPTVADGIARRVLAGVEEVAAGRFDCVAGIGSAVAGIERAHVSAEQARLARTAAGRGAHGPVVRWDSLGELAVLLRLPGDAWRPDALPAEVQRLLEVDRDGQLTRTLRAFLDHAGHKPAAAAALHIHRTTLYYRLDRIRDLVGLDLDDGRTRLVTHLGLAMLEAEGLRQREEA